MNWGKGLLSVGIVLGLSVALMVTVACQKTEKAGPSPHETLSNSLHGTTYGMKYWYQDANPTGLYEFTHVPYDSLSCQNCHVESCNSCHEQEGDHPAMDKCLNCHGRQKIERMLLTDVHYDQNNMDCADCHTAREAHGDGNAYNSLLEEGVMDVSCEGCHPPDQLPSNAEHSRHLSNIDCTACHNQGVPTCYNCYFESELQYGVKLFHTPPIANWVFLVNYQGKVHAANIMAITYNGQSFVAIAPYSAHTVSRQGRTCNDCHNSQAVEQYQQTGTITVTSWNADSASLNSLSGVIPVPPNYTDALKFAFLQCVSGCDNPETAEWDFLKNGVDRWQILFGSPLTESQMDKLLNNP